MNPLPHRPEADGFAFDLPLFRLGRTSTAGRRPLVRKVVKGEGLFPAVPHQWT